MADIATAPWFWPSGQATLHRSLKRAIMDARSIDGFVPDFGRQEVARRPVVRQFVAEAAMTPLRWLQLNDAAGGVCDRLTFHAFPIKMLGFGMCRR
jgi:hypothetical protein